ncbi:MAG: 50S ribosomal protein L22 [Treponema sp.]|jgi:large subunit ribosomal protein L22|nr:50S ribosomal protein L22 [Treponema sp.]
MRKREGYRAVAKYFIVSPFKIRPVADLVRRKKYPDAIALLDTMPHKGALLIKKVLKSGASNALSRNTQLDEGMLYIKELIVNEGPRLKRVWFRARGRADMLLKRMCHISVVISEKGGVNGAKG